MNKRSYFGVAILLAGSVLWACSDGGLLTPIEGETEKDMTQALAAKPQKPGGGKGDKAPLSGLIYFSDFDPDIGYRTYVMDLSADPSTVSLLPENVKGALSRDRHGVQDAFWFVQVRDVAGTYPDGAQRQELFALPENGDESRTVQLTNDPLLQPTGGPTWDPHTTMIRWSPGDVMISFTGRRFETSGSVSEGGVYVFTVEYDTGGDLSVGNPPTLLVSAPIYTARDCWDTPTCTFPDIGGFDWSAQDPSRITYGMTEVTPGLFVEDASGTSIISDSGIMVRPRWSASTSASPDGRIVFGYVEVYVIDPDGSSRRAVAQAPRHTARWSSHGNAEWSPSGEHFVYRYHEWGGASNVYYCEMLVTTGKGRGDGLGRCGKPIGWR